MGATFALTESVVANTRQTDDPLNGAAGGCAAGFLAGIRGMWSESWEVLDSAKAVNRMQHVPYLWLSRRVPS